MERRNHSNHTPKSLACQTNPTRSDRSGASRLAPESNEPPDVRQVARPFLSSQRALASRIEPLLHEQWRIDARIRHKEVDVHSLDAVRDVLGPTDDDDGGHVLAHAEPAWINLYMDGVRRVAAFWRERDPVHWGQKLSTEGYALGSHFRSFASSRI